MHGDKFVYMKLDDASLVSVVVGGRQRQLLFGLGDAAASVLVVALIPVVDVGDDVVVALPPFC